MQLTKILGRWMKSASPETAPDQSSSNLPKYQQALLLVEALAQRKNRTFSPIVATRVTLQSISPNVVALSERIAAFAHRLELAESLSPTDCFAELQIVTLDQFFTDSDGTYIPLEMLDTFLASSQRLLRAVERGMEKKDRNVAVSARLLGKCFTSIHNVCRAVEEAGR